MGKLEDKIGEVEYQMSCFETYDLINHIHCKKCGIFIYGKRAGEDEKDLEETNPFFKYRLCIKCITSIALKELNKEGK